MKTSEPTLSRGTTPGKLPSIKTTVDIPDDLYGQARKLAAARGQQVAALITEGLQKLVVAQRPHPRAKAGKNGKTHPAALPPKAAQWLNEWRALGQKHPLGETPSVSAAKTISGMRR